MAITKSDFNNNPYLGVYCICSESLLIVPPAFEERKANEMKEILQVETLFGTISGATVLGSLAVLNSRGMVISDSVSPPKDLPEEIAVGHVATRFNALGNLVVANDVAALCSPLLEKEALKIIGDTLEVKVEIGTIAGLSTVGSCAVATSKGVLTHPRVTEREQEMLEELFDVEVATSTANFGTPYVGACVVANSKGAAAGEKSTGIELGRIEDGLGL